MDRGNSPQGHKESNWTEQLTLSLQETQTYMGRGLSLPIFPISLFFLINLLLSAPTHMHPNTLIFSLDFWYEDQLLIRLRARLVKSMLNLHGGSDEEVARMGRKTSKHRAVTLLSSKSTFLLYQEKKEWEKCCRSDLCFPYFSQDLSPKGHVRKITWWSRAWVSQSKSWNNSRFLCMLCVVLDTLFNSCVPQFNHLWNWDDNSTSWGCCRD